MVQAALSAFERPPVFRPAAREVDNWRRQAALALDLAPEASLTLAAGDDPRGTTRCVRLNNYWCIKRAGWAGEIAADGEGHVAFASAREGAAVAALLLRRYYMDFGLKSARAIVSRWAPAQCGLVARSGAPRAGARLASAGPLASRGLGNTLRARWLATHTIGGYVKTAAGTRPATRPQGGAKPALSNTRSAGKPAPRVAGRSVVPDLVGPLLATPNIMVGPGSPSQDLNRAPVRLAMLPYAGIPMGPTPGKPAALPPLTSCASDGVRIANYAAKTAEGVAAPDADLGLFDAAGKPTANLARVMANMAAVEIGPLRASDALVAAGIAALAARGP